MTRNTGTEAEVLQLRTLLTMSRELMQTDEPVAALALAGRAMAALTRFDGAMLLVRGGIDEAIGFDRHGQPRKADRGHAWYRTALQKLNGGSGAAVRPAPGLLLLGVPAHDCMAILAVGWTGDVDRVAWSARQRLLATVLELCMATLGRISTRASLEDLVSTQYEQMAGTAQAHADELARRDQDERAIRALALTDVLTGLNNRRGFFVRAEQLFRLAKRRHTGCAVIYADIDGLELVNDRLGHETGDHLIRDAAAVLRESLRDTDVLARFGGDEFVAFVLDDAHPRAILARLKDNLRAFNLMQERTYPLAISAGAVPCDISDGRNLLAYVQLADREMYLHKRNALH